MSIISNDFIAEYDNCNLIDNVDPQWTLLVVDSAEKKDRIRALEDLEQLLHSIYKEDSEFALINDSLKIPISFAVLTRCDDISPTVRAKALTVLSHTIRYILKVLEETMDQTVLETEDSEDVSQEDLSINGNHRFFWYFLPSFEERKRELIEMLLRRVDDNSASVRKVALSALEGFVVADYTFLTEENIMCFESACKDAKSSVQRQSIMSLSALLNTYQESGRIQDLWLKCILPLIDDPEDSVQSKALSALEDLFLSGIFSSVYAHRIFCMNLLRKFASADFTAFHKFFKNALRLWKSMDKLKPETVDQLMAYDGTEMEECVWFYVSYFSLFCPLSSAFSNFCVERLVMFQRTGKCLPFTENVMKTFLNVFQNVPLETLEIVQYIISCGLQDFFFSVELIPLNAEILLKIHNHKGTKSEFAAFSFALLQKCRECLSDMLSKGYFPEDLAEELLVKLFCTMTELCNLDSSYITPNVIRILLNFSTCNGPQVEQSSISVKAHALAALGKLCLRDENLAKELLPILKKELFKPENNATRNNVAIILANMCERYSCFADKCIPLIILCFKDELPIIRHQAIILTINLLRNRYIKWQTSLFFGFLSSLSDKEEFIREIGEFSLSQLLPEHKKTMFFDFFVDSIFVLNNFLPPDNERIMENVEKMWRFSIPGDSRREERMIIYKFLLKSMSIKERACLIRPIGDILLNVAESVYPLCDQTECIIRDCFGILSCNEIRSNDLDCIEDIDEDTEYAIRRTELDIRKTVLVDPIVPVIINLKNILMDSESDLMFDIVLFLKDFLSDFQADIKDILAGDKNLQQVLELEIMNDTERERMASRIRENLQRTNKQPEENPPAAITLNDLQKLIGKPYINVKYGDNQTEREQSRESVSLHQSSEQASTSENSETNETDLINSESDMEF